MINSTTPDTQVDLAPPVAISVIIPVRNDPRRLQACLEALDRSTFRDFEVVVVDDASEDTTPSFAEGTQTRVLRLPQRRGPAIARNHGAQAARGDHILFVDADICVHADTLAKVHASFTEDPSTVAVFGSYDTAPVATNLISQYRNLLHHYTHQRGKPQAATFWAGCGAVKRTVFEQLHGFSTHYRRPCIEDIELGVRIRKAGYSIRLDKDIQVTHLKQWRFLDMVRTDLFDRAIPWSQLILQEKSLPNDLNLHWSQRASALLSLGFLACLFMGVLCFGIVALLPLVIFALVVGIDYGFPGRSGQKFLLGLVVMAAVASAVPLFRVAGFWTLLPMACLAGVVALNFRLYLLLARVHHPLFALGVIPLHIVHFVISAFAFAGCVVNNRLREIRVTRKPETT